MKNLINYVYCSRRSVKVDQSDQNCLSSIAASSKLNNGRDEISGVLLASRFHFFQILEGPFDNVVATMARIKQDVRHDSVEMLQMISIERRKFSNWNMAVIDLAAPEGSLTAELLSRAVAGDRQYVAILQGLAAKLVNAEPMQLESV